MGGHNVLARGSGPFAIRADRLHLSKSPAISGNTVETSVLNLEFLGSSVSVSLQDASRQEITATVPDDIFFKHPIEIGETQFVSWDEKDVHALAK